MRSPISKKRLDLFLKATAEHCRARIAASEQIVKGNASFSFNPLRWFGGGSAGTDVTFTKQEISGITEAMMKAVNQENAGRELTRQGRCLERFTEELLEMFHAESKSIYPVIAIDSRRFANQSPSTGGDPLGTNADMIRNLLIEKLNISSTEIFAVRAHPMGWDPKVVIYLKPRLTFLHWSTFEVADDRRECSVSKYDVGVPICIRLVDNLARLVRDTKAPIIVYTRTPDACRSAPSFIDAAIKDGRFPKEFKARLMVFEMSLRGRNNSFDTEGTKSDMAWLAKSLLDSQPKSISRPGICRL